MSARSGWRPSVGTTSKALGVLVAFCVGVASVLTPQVAPVMATAVSMVVFPFVLNFPFHPEWQIQRRLLHMCTGSLIVFVSHRLEASQSILHCALFMLTLGAAVIEVSRRTLESAANLFSFFFGNLLRGDEAAGTRVPGAFYFLPGAGLALYLFPVEEARLAILALAFGDPAAGFCGASHSRWNCRLAGKSLFGFVACAGATALAVFAYAHIAAVPLPPLLRLSVLSAVAESLSLVDDNLTMPLFFCILRRLV